MAHIELLLCPRCESDEVLLSSVQTFMANTGEFYCHSVKVQDDYSPANCLECEWQGQRKQLKIMTERKYV